MTLMTTAIGSATEHPLNRNLFIADNLSLLRRLNNDSIDLICIDPPFAKNQTFIGNLRPPLSAEEQAGELAMLSAWGISSERDAEAAGIFWANGVDSPGSGTSGVGKAIFTRNGLPLLTLTAPGWPKSLTPRATRTASSRPLTSPIWQFV